MGTLIFEKTVGPIDETGGIPLEEVSGVDGGLGIAMLRDGSAVMAAKTVM